MSEEPVADGAGSETPPPADPAEAPPPNVPQTLKTLGSVIGHRQHDTLIGNLPFRPEVVVYSQRQLHLEPEEGVEVTVLDESEEGYRFRYSGLRLLFRDNGRYFLLPNKWVQEKSAVIILPDESWLRFEFVKGDGR
jgi:hypothetical protein